MSKKTRSFLITGGRAPSALDLARQLHASGHRVIVAESQAYPIAKASRAVEKTYLTPKPNQDYRGFIAALEKIIQDEKIDDLIPTCEESFYVSRGKKDLEKLCRVWTDDHMKMKRLHDKWAFNRWVSELGMVSLRTALCHSRESMKRAIEAELEKNPHVVVKPSFSRFASKTFVLARGNKLPEVAEPSSVNPWIVQEAATGSEFCSYSVAYEGKLIAHSVYSHEFTAGKGAGICFENEMIPEIEKWVSDFVEKIGYTGQIAFDFMCTSSGRLVPLECNPRATSGIHLFGGTKTLASALADPDQVTAPARPHPKAKGMIAAAMFLYGIIQITSPRRFLKFLQILIFSREVLFRFEDPLPFFYQFMSLFHFWRESLGSGKTMMEVSTQDIEWNGNEIL